MALTEKERRLHALFHDQLMLTAQAAKRLKESLGRVSALSPLPD